MVAEVVDVKARRQSTEPWGRTPRFYRGDGCKKSNRPPRSLSLPRYTAASHRGIYAHDPYPFPPKSRRTFRLPQADQDSFPTEGIRVKKLFSSPPRPKSSRAGPIVSTAVPTREGPMSSQNLGVTPSVFGFY